MTTKVEPRSTPTSPAGGVNNIMFILKVTNSLRWFSAVSPLCFFFFNLGFVYLGTSLPSCHSETLGPTPASANDHCTLKTHWYVLSHKINKTLPSSKLTVNVPLVIKPNK